MWKTEGDVKREFELLNQLMPGNKGLDFLSIQSLYPSALSNLCRNRYQDVLPEESTRVRLENCPEGDYINANYITGHKQLYISCQAPLPNTTVHFWSMVWEQHSPVIIMLTRVLEGERKKADVYWPLFEGDQDRYGSITVTLDSVKTLPYITIRSLTLHNHETNETRNVVQLHYTEWPDFGVPSTTANIRELIRLMNIYREIGSKNGATGPIVAHCSAGIGRCGTFIAILIALEKLLEGVSCESLNLVDIVVAMRKARWGMVQTDLQYLFIYRVLDDIVREKELKQLSCRHSSEDISEMRSFISCKP